MVIAPRDGCASTGRRDRKSLAQTGACLGGFLVILPPDFEDIARFVKRAEPVLVQAFVAQFAVEAFGEAILAWPAAWQQA